MISPKCRTPERRSQIAIKAQKISPDKKCGALDFVALEGSEWRSRALLDTKRG
jgi:hypothetical protein